MFEVEVRKAQPKIKQTEPLITSGSLNAFSVHFVFNEDWDGMTKFATFRKRGTKDVYELLLSDNDVADIPWELLVEPDGKIQVGAYGIKIGDDKHIRLPTIWLNLEDISEGVLYGVAGREPTPDIYAQFVEALKNIPRPMTADELRDILTGKEDA